MRARTRAACVIAGAAALLCGMAAPALALTPTGDYAVYTACPVDARAMLAVEFSRGAECLWSQTTGGQVTIGRKHVTVGTRHETVPIVNPILLQGGYWFNRAGTQVWVNTQPTSQTLVDPGQPVPGTNAFQVVTELAGRIQISNSNTISQEGTAVQLPVMFHLITPALSCYIGSHRDPIVLNLTTGTTSPPPPNKPISGATGSLSILDGGAQLTLTGDSLVDNAFSVPKAHGCGPGGDLNQTVNEDSGAPVAGGQQHRGPQRHDRHRGRDAGPRQRSGYDEHQLLAEHRGAGGELDHLHGDRHRRRPRAGHADRHRQLREQRPRQLRRRRDLHAQPGEHRHRELPGDLHAGLGHVGPGAHGHDHRYLRRRLPERGQQRVRDRAGHIHSGTPVSRGSGLRLSGPVPGARGCRRGLA